jgi:hypothetical protein
MTPRRSNCGVLPMVGLFSQPKFVDRSPLGSDLPPRERDGRGLSCRWWTHDRHLERLAEEIALHPFPEQRELRGAAPRGQRREEPPGAHARRSA